MLRTRPTAASENPTDLSAIFPMIEVSVQFRFPQTVLRERSLLPSIIICITSLMSTTKKK